jgi:hypothetical protein
VRATANQLERTPFNNDLQGSSLDHEEDNEQGQDSFAKVKEPPAYPLSPPLDDIEITNSGATPARCSGPPPSTSVPSSDDHRSNTRRKGAAAFIVWTRRHARFVGPGLS